MNFEKLEASEGKKIKRIEHNIFLSIVDRVLLGAEVLIYTRV
jgi:hypothetical protein